MAVRRKEVAPAVVAPVAAVLIALAPVRAVRAVRVALRVTVPVRVAPADRMPVLVADRIVQRGRIAGRGPAVPAMVPADGSVARIVDRTGRADRTTVDLPWRRIVVPDPPPDLAIVREVRVVPAVRGGRARIATVPVGGRVRHRRVAPASIPAHRRRAMPRAIGTVTRIGGTRAAMPFRAATRVRRA